MKHRSRQGVRTGRCRVEQGRGGIVASQGRVEPGVAQRQSAEVSKLQDRRERRSVQILCASEARLKQRLTENTSVYDHDSDLGSSLGEKRSFQCTRLPSYRRACKKGSPKAWPRQRADECVHGSRPQYRQYSVVCETDTCTQGKEKRQSSRVRVLTGHQKRHKVTICNGVHINT